MANYKTVSEVEFVKWANEHLEEIEKQIKELEKQKYELLNTIHMARTYYRYTKEKAHAPTEEELNDFYEIKENK